MLDIYKDYRKYLSEPQNKSKNPSLINTFEEFKEEAIKKDEEKERRKRETSVISLFGQFRKFLES